MEMEKRQVSITRRTVESPYMEWAKTKSHARFNLATSGLVHYPMRALGARLDDVELSGPSWYGYAPLQEALARKAGVASDCVVAAVGTSFANHLAMASLIEPGDEVLIEQPTYDPLLAVAGYLGARIRRFPRRREDGFAVDPSAVERNLTPLTRLIVITNLHNPSSAPVGESTLRQIGEMARRSNARVLVDEVYLEAVSVQAPHLAVRSAFHLGSEFVVTSSLTKAYGLSGLRCGWILADPALARKIWRLNDLFIVIPAHPAEQLSVIALDHLDTIAGCARSLLAANRLLLDRFLDARDDLDCARPEFGTVVFPRLKSGKVDPLCDLLRDRYDTSVVPGRFFEMPDHFRLGIGCETDMLAGGLERLSTALDTLGRRQPV
jgi:aspartate/methionine/tyrosine aminotransferase